MVSGQSGVTQNAVNDFTVDFVGAGLSTTFEVEATIASNFMGSSLTNNAEITGGSDVDGGADASDVDSTPGDDGTPDDLANDNDTADTMGGDDQDPAEVLIEQVYDLAIDKQIDLTSTPGPFAPGADVTYEICVINQGTLDASMVEVTDNIPSGLSFVSSPDFVSVGGDAVASGLSIPAGGTLCLSITLQIDANFQGGSIINDAEITADDGDDVDSAPGDDATPDDIAGDGDTADTVGGDDQDPAEIMIGQVYDLAIDKQIDLTATPGPFGPGDDVTYEICVLNQGSLDALLVEVTDYIPVGLSLIHI